MATTSAVTSSKPFCAICTEEILPSANISKLNCDHEYHQDCLQPWLDANHNTCPLDRERITSINGIPIERTEEEVSYAHVHGIQNSLIEARPLQERNIRVIQSPAILSADPLERQAARVQLISNATFF